MISWNNSAFCTVALADKTVVSLGEVFGKGRLIDDVTAQWLTKYQQDSGEAMCEMVNFILRCTGTDLTVETEQAEDLDNVPHRVKDLQDLYNEQGIFDYPIISKAPKFRSFQQILKSFFMTLIETFHHSSVLYTDKDLFESLLIWVSPLSTAQCRPFRHTATVIFLAMMMALCDIARELTTAVSTSRKQLQGEKKKKTVNKGRMHTIQMAVQEGEKKLEAVDEFLKDAFNIVFVHRYRDIDPKIRSECMEALGEWVRSYRRLFFDGQHIRYFGWTLSDQAAHTRLIVVNQLRSLYENKDNIAGLRQFTERFQARMVEMATQDADVSVRAAVVELLDLIRDTGLLEPADIDTVGKLVFDTEPSVRKAAGRFFVANVQEVYDSTTQEVRDELNELFAHDDEEDDDFESPKRSWLKFKCLADILQAYGGRPERDPVGPWGALSGSPIVSRFVLATEAIYPYFDELSQWQSLAGYLLYDHSQITNLPAEDDDMVRKLYKLEEGQEGILLEVLYCAVKLRILDIAKLDGDKRGRRVKALTEKIPELQEKIAHGLTQIIPCLLKKFGAVPEAASSILRLEHLVDLDKIQDLQKDAKAYSSLLNDINRQFLTHSDEAVLAEATVSFVHAKTSDELREALETRTQELCDDTLDTLSRLVQERDVQEGHSLSEHTLNALNNTAKRICNLASVIDCTAVLETTPSPSSKRNKIKLDTPFNALILLASRGLRVQDLDQETAEVETELVMHSLGTLMFYFMWKLQGLASMLDTGKSSSLEGTAYFENLAKLRGTFVGVLLAIMRERSGLDDIRFTATTAFLELHMLFGTIRHVGEVANNSEDIVVEARNLISEIGSESKALISKIHSIAERAYAKKLHRSLEPANDDPALEPGINDEPADDDEEDDPSEPEDSEDSETGDGEKDSRAIERLRDTILAEQRLCELTGKIILAMVGHVIVDSNNGSINMKQKLLRNKSRLGHNYKEILSFLEGRRKTRRGGKSHNRKSKKETKQEEQQQYQAGENGHLDNDEGDDNNVEEDGEEDLRARGLLDEAAEENDERDRGGETEDEDDAMEE